MVYLGLKAGLDDIEGARDGSGKPSRSGASEKFQLPSNIPALLPAPSPGLSLLVEHELERGKGEVAVESRFVAVEKRRGTFDPDDGARRIKGPPVVVAGVEEGVIITPLKL